MRSKHYVFFREDRFVRFKSALFAIAALLAATPIAKADTAAAPVPDTTQKTISGLYDSLCTAAQDPSDKNLAAMFAIMAPDYVEIDPKGKEHKRDEVVATQRMQMKQIETDDCSSSLDSFTAVDANTVTVVDTAHVTGSIQGSDAKHQLDVTSKSLDTWKLLNGTWMESQSKSLRVLVKVDGNVVQDTGN
jgi:hypothetical protein